MTPTSYRRAPAIAAVQPVAELETDLLRRVLLAILVSHPGQELSLPRKMVEDPGAFEIRSVTDGPSLVMWAERKR